MKIILLKNLYLLKSKLFMLNLVFSFCLISEQSFTQNIQMVFDLNTNGMSTSNSNPSSFAVYNNKLYFSANEGGFLGKELYVINNNDSPHLVADIFSGYNNGSNPQQLTVFQNKLFFICDNRIWVYDSINSPYMFISYYNLPLYCYANDRSLLVFNNKLYINTKYTFYGYPGNPSPTYSDTTFVFDGISNPVAITNNSPCNFDPTKHSCIKFKSKIFFNSVDSHGDELWVCDSLNNAAIYSDIAPGSTSSNPHCFFIYNNKFFFVASLNNTQETQLWSCDGVNQPAIAVNMNNGFCGDTISGYAILNNKLYFEATDQSHGSELWVYDGINPAHLVEDIYVGGTGSHPRKLVVFNNKLYFTADDGIHGSELWTYDETIPPYMVMGIQSGAQSSMPNDYIMYYNHIYFSANDGIHGQELWTIDSNNVLAIININQHTDDLNPTDFIVFKNKLIFKASDSDGINPSDIWGYDGVNYPSLIKEFTNSGFTAFDNFIVFNNKLYFYLDGNLSTTGIWEYDGENPPQIKFPDVKFFYPHIFNNKLYYYSENIISNEFGLYEYNGVTNPTHISNSMIFPFDTLNNKLYLTDINWNIWSYDGINPPSLAVDIFLSTNSQNLISIIIFNNKIYFSVLVNGKSIIYEYNGVNPPSQSLVINADTIMVDWTPFVVFNNKLYFSKGNDTSYELYVFDGLNSPIRFSNIHPGFSFLSPYNFKVYNNKLYFSSYGNDNSINLIWSYDGLNQPLLIHDFTNSGYILNHSFTGYKNKIYLSATDRIHGSEVWSTLNCVGQNANITDTACFQYQLNNELYTSSGTYKQLVLNSSGCDSIITLNLSILQLSGRDSSASVCMSFSSVDLFNYLGNNYQPGGIWYDINNTGALSGSIFNLANVDSNTYYYFNYVVQGIGTCNNDTTKLSIYTSICSNINETILDNISFFPNPANEKIELNGLKEGNIEILDLQGIIIKKIIITENNQSIKIFDLRSGIYFVKIYSGKNIYLKKLVKL